MPYTPKIFIAYSRKDESLLKELKTHLTPIERSGKVEIWYDGKIEPGIVWEQAIKKHLHAADIILLLVSADAIASDYFYDKEMKDALERHEKGSARVVPLILRPCAWDATPLAALQAIPKDGLAVTSWTDRDAAFSDAVGSIWDLIQTQIADTKAMKEKEEQERLQKELDAKREIELGKEKAAAAKYKEEQALEMERLEKEAQIRKQKREVLEKEAAAKRAVTAQKWITKFKSLIKKPAIWGSIVLLVVAMGAIKMNSGSNEKELEEDKEAAVEENKNYSGQYHFVLKSHSKDMKIPVIKEVRRITALGLKRSKEIVDKLPYVFNKKVDLQEAKKIKASFKKIGAHLDFLPVEEEFKFSVSVESFTNKHYDISHLREIILEHGYEGIENEKFEGRFPYVISKDIPLNQAIEIKRLIEKYGGKVRLQ